MPKTPAVIVSSSVWMNAPTSPPTLDRNNRSHINLDRKQQKRNMASVEEKPTTDSTDAAITKDGDDDDSDVELEGMDLEDGDGDGDGDGDDDDNVDVDMEPAAATTDSPDAEEDKETTDKLATEDQDELEAAHRERTELMAVERKKVAAPTGDGDGDISMENKLQYLLSQSEVFAHFLAGSVAASDKKRGGGKKKGSRGKKNRMTEAEEDAQLLKTAESKRSVVRLNKQVWYRAVQCSGIKQTSYYLRLVLTFKISGKDQRKVTVAIVLSKYMKYIYSNSLCFYGVFKSLRFWPITVRCTDTN
jgi:hypothetical protein